MGKIETTLKAEIARLSRRETRKLVAKQVQELRRLRQRVSLLDREVRALKAARAEEEAKAKVKTVTDAVATKSAAGTRLSAGLIQKLRKRLNISQTDLAKLVGVTGAAVGFWESGKSMPKPDTRARIVALRSLGRREVRRLLAECGG